MMGHVESSISDLARYRTHAGTVRSLVGALSIFALAFVVSAIFRDFLQPHVFLFFFVAVAFTAWLAGFWTSILVSVLSVLGVNYLFFSPVGTVTVDYPRSLLSFLSFLAVVGLVSWMTSRLAAERERAVAHAEREAQARLELMAIIEHLPVGIWLTDEGGRITYGNPEAQRIWGGVAYVGVGGVDRYKGWWADSGRRIESGEWALERAIRNHEASLGEEIEIEAFDGARRFIRNSAIPILDRDDRLQGVVMVNEDVTDLKRTEHSLREATEELSAIIRASPLAIIALDLESRIQAWNPAAERLFGWTEEEVVGQPTTIVPAGRQSEVEAEFDAAARGEVFTGLETERLRRDGTTVPVSVSSAPLRDSAGEIRGVIVIFEDISERRRAEAAQQFLVEAGRVLTTSLDYHLMLREVARLAVPELADGCLIDILENGELHPVATEADTPARGRLIRDLLERWAAGQEAPHSVPRALSTGRAELISTVTDAMLRGAARDEAELEELRTVELRSVLTVPLSARGRTLGSLTLVATQAGRVFDEDDLSTAEQIAVRAAFAVDNARLHAEAREAQAEAERRAREEASLRGELQGVMESRERLMRGFGHDVKNPLGAADGYLELLEEGVMGDLAEKQREGVERARRSIASALQLVEDLVELARAEAGHLEVECEELDLGQIVRDTADEFRAQAAAKGLDFDVHVSSELPVIESDPARIRQVLGNLLSNAMKYTDEGGVTVAAETREGGGAPSPGHWAVIAVSNTGRGIPEEQQRLLFQEFVRLKPGTGFGAGLGLAISRRIADLLGGDLSLESRAGEGSTFSLWLPVEKQRIGDRG